MPDGDFQIPGLAPFRQENPEYEDVGDVPLAKALYEKSYSDVSKGKYYTALGVTDLRDLHTLGDRSNFVKGWRTGFPLTNPALLGGYVEAIGTAFDLNDLTEYGRGLIAKAETGADITPPVPGFEDIRVPKDATNIDQLEHFFEDVWRYASFGLGQGLGSTIAPLAGGAVGATAGGLTLGPGGAIGGALLGAALPSHGLNTTDIWGGLKETLAEKIESGEVDAGYVARVAMVGGGAMAALDTIGALGLLRGITAGFKKAVSKRLISALALSMGRGATIEGSTEAAQEAISQGIQANMAGEDEFTRERVNAIINGAIIGAMTGAAFGIGGARTGRAPAPAAPPPTAEEAAPEAAPIVGGPAAVGEVPDVEEEPPTAPVVPPPITEPPPAGAPPPSAPPIPGAPPIGEPPAGELSPAYDAEPEPSDAQIEAGNFKKGRINIFGLDIAVETPEGFTRRSKPGVTPAWEVTMPVHYGYLRRTTGADGEQVDVFVNEPTAREMETAGGPVPVFVIDQIDPATGKFDEHKAVIGAFDERMARAIYDQSYTDEDPQARIGAVTQMTVDDFKEFLKTGDLTQPLTYKSTEAAPAVPTPITEPTPAPTPAPLAPVAAAPTEAPAAPAEGMPPPAPELILEPTEPTEPKPKPTRARGKPRGLPTGRVDVLTFIAARGGIRDDEGHNLRKARDGQRFIPGRGSLLRPEGRSIDEIGEILHEAGYFGEPEFTDRPTEQQVLEMLDRALTGEKVYIPESQAPEPTTQEVEAANEREIERVAAEFDLTLNEAEMAATIEGIEGGMSVEDAIEAAVIRVQQDTHDEFVDNTPDEEDILFDAPSAAAAEPPAGRGGEVVPEPEPAEAPVPGPSEEDVAQRPERAGAVEAPSEEEAVAPTTEPTPEGEQVVIPGAEKISDKKLAERGMEGAKRPTAAQRDADEGLFDTGARRQKDIFDQKPREGDVFTPTFLANRDEIKTKLKEIVKQIAPGAKVKAVDRIGRIAKGRAEYVRGRYDPTENLIAVAINYDDPVVTVRHELIHALRSMGLFTPTEWKNLERQAKYKWRGEYGVDHRYGDLSQSALNEEGIAEAFGDFRNGAKFPPGIRRIFDKIKTLLTRTANMLRGMGFQTADDIFARVEEGEVGRRPAKEPTGTEPSYALPTGLQQAVDSFKKRAYPVQPTRKERIRKGFQRFKKPTTVQEAVEDDLFGMLRFGMVDDLHGFAKLEKWTNDGVLKEARSSAMKLAHLSRGINDTIQQALTTGIPRWINGEVQIDTSIKSLVEIVEEIPHEVVEFFELYLLGKRARELDAVGKEHYFTQEDMTTADALGKQFPEFKGWSDDVQAWNTGIMDFAEDSGLISKELRTLFEDMYKNYVPFYRLMEEGGVKARGAKKGFEGQHPSFFRITGAEKPPERPFLALERNAARLIEAGFKNVVMLRAEQQNHQLGNAFMSPLPRTIRKAMVSTKQMIKDLEAQGAIIDPTMVDTDTLRALWSFGNKPKGDNMVSLVRGGDVRYYEVHDPVLYGSMTMLHRAPLPFLKNILAPARIAKRLLTGAVGLDPSFQVANFIRDTVHAAVVSHSGFRPFVDSTKGITSRAKNDQNYKDFLTSGAGMSSLFEHDRPTMHRVVENKLTKTGLGRIIDSPKSLLGMMEHYAAYFEYSTRVGAYKRFREKGMSRSEAAYEARNVSTDFARRGAFPIIRLLAETVPFFNAGVQGLERTWRGAGEIGGRKGTARAKKEAHRALMNFTLKAGMIGLASMALYIINRDDERYKELSEYQRDLYWHFFDLVPGLPHVKIPKPFEIGMLSGSLVERAFELAIEKNGERFLERFTWLLQEMFRLDPVPAILRPPLRVATNWDEFRRRPVIPRHLEKAAPEEQYDATTAISAVGLGRATGVSPKHIETLVNGYLGAWGGYLLSMSDMMLSTLSDDYPTPPAIRIWERPVIRRFIGPDVPTTTRQLQEFWEMRQEVTEAAASFQVLLAYGEIDRARTLMGQSRRKLAVKDSFDKIGKQMTKMSRLITRISMQKGDAGRRRDMIDNLRKAQQRLARASERLVQSVKRD